MRKEQIHAWIFLPVSVEPGQLDEIIGTADAIIHAIPTHGELQDSLGWLIGNGFISRQDKSYQYTAQGKALRDAAGAANGTIFQIWEYIESEFRKCAGLPAVSEDLSQEEVMESYNKYRKWLWKTYRRITGK